jgi:acyl carrier protein
VFIKNPSKDNLFITIQKHKVTHLFFVPLFFNFIVKGILSEVKKDPIKLKKFNKALKFSLFLQTILPNIGRRFARIMFKDIYKSTFGNSLRFLISGGSDAKKETLEILNGIGFILVNGYGSSEVGITSLVLSKNIKQRITPNIGKPLLNAMYSISPDNTLIINSSSMCYLIKSSEHKTTKLTSSSYYDTLDLTKKDKYGNYIITGRADDLVILENGNNINLNQVAANITINTVDNYILLNINSKLSLVLESKNINISNYKNVFEEISNLNLQSEGISSIYFTNSLLENGTIKMSRKKILNDISLGNIKLVKYTDFFNTFENDENNKNLIIVEDIKTILAGFLDIDINEINLNSNIIYDLGASSLEYYSVIQTINNKYMVQLNIDKICMNVSDIVKDIVSKKEI